MRLDPRLFALILALCAGTVSAEQAWRWVDEDGRVHYGDRARPGAVAVKARPGGTARTAPPIPAEPSRIESPPAVAEQDGGDCAKHQRKLETYRRSERIVERSPLGGERYYTAEERAQLIEIAEQQVAGACDEAG